MTPMMQQYKALKAENPDCLLFFRLGDFYELFFEDALVTAPVLELTLTKRGKGTGQEVPMCGVPYHAADSYIARLVKRGYRIAICEQTEAPEEARKRGGHKAIVKREVVRIITPGTLTEDHMLSAKHHNFLALLCDDPEGRKGDTVSFAVVDISTGDFYLESCPKDKISTLVDRVTPAEVVVPDGLLQTPELFDVFKEYQKVLTPLPDSRFDARNAAKRLQEYFDVKTLDGFGQFSRSEVVAASTLVDYVKLTQRKSMMRLSLPRRFCTREQVDIDPATRRNLELVATIKGVYKGSLLHLIDHTKTASGARMLSMHLANPLKTVAPLKRRQESVAFFIAHSQCMDEISGRLQHFPDVERAIARLGLGRGGPKDLAAVAQALDVAYQVRQILSSDNFSLDADLDDARRAIAPFNSLVDRLQRALREELPLHARDGNFIQHGYLQELDELFTLRDQGKKYIGELQDRYRSETGISSLKIKHNNILGYYIEVTNSNAEKIPYQFIHRQSLASALRYSSPELVELEQNLNTACSKALQLELRLYEDLVNDVLSCRDDIIATIRAVAVVDVAISHARLAVQQDYCRPTIDDSSNIDIVAGRHPVVEKALLDNGEDSFMPNGCHMNDRQAIILLTGPNMAGKSTYLRQNALIVLLAQIGAYVPAQKARIGVVDKLFSRVGASDDLARGRSTFMVEMVETAAILNQATEKSFVILDEVGRGTSTHDGMSLAWAVIEHLHDEIKCRTLFATHYHEVTTLEDSLARLACYSMKIKEWQDRAIFLHEIVKGRADKSYGLYVAKMAGVPQAVLERAAVLLKDFEAHALTAQPATDTEVAPSDAAKDDRRHDSLPNPAAASPGLPVSVTPIPATLLHLSESLAECAVDDLSPREALSLLYELRELAKACPTPEQAAMGHEDPKAPAPNRAHEAARQDLSSGHKGNKLTRPTRDDTPQDQRKLPLVAC